MYQGVPCTVDTNQCCYNEALWCPNGGPNCDRYDRGAYPYGDKQLYSDQMSNPDALAPFPNAIFWNWATIFILGFGNLGALDFQARCMAAKTPTTARIGCVISGCLTLLVGVPFAYLGSITRYVNLLVLHVTFIRRFHAQTTLLCSRRLEVSIMVPMP
jgi:hypothetical protein